MIRELIEAIERGELAEVNAVLGRMFAADQDLPWDWISNVNSAFRGSVDAALALMQAVLPGWTFSLIQNVYSKAFIAHVSLACNGEVIEDAGGSSNDNPARALLLAILKAKEGETP